MSLENTQLHMHTQPAKQDEDISLQKILWQVIRYWWIFLLSIVTAAIIAILYLRYTPAVYKVQAKILVKDSKKGGGANGMQMFEELGLLGGQNSVDNEVELLKSRTLMENTVNALQLNTRYYSEGKVKQTEVFASRLPFIVNSKDIEEDSIKTKIVLLFQGINNREFRITNDKIVEIFNYEDTLNFPFGKLVFSKFNNKNVSNEDVIKIVINRPDNSVAYFMQKMSVAVTSKTVSTIDLTLEDEVPARGALLLNTLIRIYNQMNTEDKNRVADSTITFIDNRLGYVTSELGEVEENMEQFRQRNQLTDLSAQGKLLLENSSDYFKELSKTEVQISIVQSLEKYLNDTQNTSRTIPAGLVIEDPTFASLVEKYNTLQLEKNRQLQTTTEGNPVVERLTVQIENLKSDIIANLGTIKRSMEITRSQLKGRTNSFESQIRQVPRKERAFIEISRQQAIKQELYLYLLKKREETAVSKAANIDNARIIDSAKADQVPFAPSRSVVVVSALLLGLILPSTFLVGRNLFNNKVENKSDIKRATTAPIVGEIGRSPLKGKMVIKQSPRHPISEQFRLLRTNLDFMLPNSKEGTRIIMLTSSISGEGKSFLSLNLATLLAVGGKKVALLEFDLRKPKLSSYLGMDNSEGITSFLIGKTESVQHIVREVPEVDNLVFLGSGPIPPNPAELISNGRTSLLFEQLKVNYDHIIVDAPPVGVVTDALLLSAYVSLTLYVIRQGYTNKDQLQLLDELYSQKKIENIGIVVNDLKKQKGYGYGYGYGYGDYGQDSKS